MYPRILESVYRFSFHLSAPPTHTLRLSGLALRACSEEFCSLQDSLVSSLESYWSAWWSKMNRLVGKRSIGSGEIALVCYSEHADLGWARNDGLAKMTRMLIIILYFLQKHALQIHLPLPPFSISLFLSFSFFFLFSFSLILYESVSQLTCSYYIKHVHS